MIFAKIFTHTLFFCALLIPFTPLKGAPIRPINIESLKELDEYTRSFYKTKSESDSDSDSDSDSESGSESGSESEKSRKLGIICDFHGVITKEKKHNPPLHLNKGSKSILMKLEQEEIPVIVATGWPNFAAVQEEVIRLELDKILDVDPALKAPLENIELVNAKQLEGYRNGSLVSLKFTGEELFLQKGYAFHCFNPDIPYTDIYAIDDSPDNLRQIAKDFENTIHATNGCTLTLFYVGPNSEFARHFPISKLMASDRRDLDTDSEDE